jgi:hypothetical protein
MSKPRTIQDAPDEPESTTDQNPPEDAQADRTASADTLLSPTTATEPSIKNR